MSSARMEWLEEREERQSEIEWCGTGAETAVEKPDENGAGDGEDGGGVEEVEDTQIEKEREGENGPGSGEGEDSGTSFGESKA